ncbi:efflux RND transporter periplasmic adaptor subunit [Mucilaginibacter myungsuensis]|uniref:Efflux RND transporter periplasmic adaptor subunit n=1 Tax=Mucilaginibacter myungsuensis TaxID=649104 RepID=A0A929KYQ5_9SPHI|nr:efflux RND transporter periplasmic adaptor subunit [Mucilaginibacter myungsuensis]MBE9663627.1 efflux RND transporter periplasmic adaptor subunit [Mucilaginibacter myungsuensis]MDN3599049.1 efflux RND transporter periplasmic adaptor subunit [Mucilaginibacter myungsuensis]
MKTTFVLMGLCAVLGYTSCKQKTEEKEADEKLLVTSPIKMDTTVINSYVGQVRSIRHIELRAQERGYLEKSFVDEGAFVHKGQLLFRIMPQLYNAEMQKAEAEVDMNQIEYQNTKKLRDSNIVAPNELAMAKAKLKKAQAELNLMKVHFQFTEIRAPFDGIIDRLQVRPGSLVDEGDLLTTLADNSQIWVYYNVPEAEYLDFKTKNHTEATQVNLIMANHEKFQYPGKVETIEADFDNETGNIPFRATFPNPKGLLRYGETGNVEMTIPLKGALIIPQKATFEVLEKRYVYVVDKDDRVQAKEITIGADMNDLYEVTSGISATDKILLEGLRKVKNNDKIAYLVKDMHAVMPTLKLHAE